MDKEKLTTDKTKTLIQNALWDMYKATGIEEYNELYQKWYENYESIEISGLDGSENK